MPSSPTSPSRRRRMPRTPSTVRLCAVRRSRWMLPSPEDLAAHVVPAVGGREAAGADVAEVGRGDSEGEAVVEVEETGELPGEVLEECAEVVEVVVVRVRALHFNSLQQLISR